MSNAIAQAVQSINLPETASRAQWTETARRLRTMAGESGVFAANDSAQDQAAAVYMSYAIVLYGAVHNDGSILKNLHTIAAGIPKARNKKGTEYTGKFAQKFAAFTAAENAGKSLFQEFAAQDQIPAARLFESITLHSALMDLLPKPKAETIAPKAAEKKVNAADEKAEAAAAAEAEKAAAIALDWPARAEKAEADNYAALEKAEAEAAEKAEAIAAAIAAAVEKAEAAAKAAAAAEADMPAKIRRFVDLANDLGIVLTKAQLAKLDKTEAAAAA